MTPCGGLDGGSSTCAASAPRGPSQSELVQNLDLPWEACPASLLQAKQTEPLWRDPFLKSQVGLREDRGRTRTAVSLAQMFSCTF